MSNLYELIRSTGILPASGQTFAMDDRVHRFRIHGEKNAKASGTYQLVEKPDGSVMGWVRDHRQGLTVPVASKSARPMTETERNALINERKLRDKAKADQQHGVAVKARKMYNGGSDGTDGRVVGHPYAVRKSVPIVGARVLRDLILVPMYENDGSICNVQCINKTGEKVFLTGGKKAGCMGGIPPKQGMGVNTIYVVEGWATGVSVWLATGCAVAIAFDCGNLCGVIAGLRERHPASKIIIAGDNDQWSTRPDGTLFNAGRFFAEKAKPDKILLPEFPIDHPGKLTDWNDFAIERGIEELRSALNG